jgi:hypothetical protein
MKSFKSILQTITALTIIIILPMIALNVSPAMADTDGPRDAGLGTNVTGIGTETWLTPENITQAGYPYATTSTLYHRHRFSNYLQGTQYGFAIPENAAITGIEVIINRKANATNPSILDTAVNLVKAGAIVGDNKASLEVWPATFTIATYGGPTDLWGTTWTPSDINSADFGVALAVGRDNHNDGPRWATVDTMQIKVYYSDASTTTVVCGAGTPIIYGNSITCVATVTSNAGNQIPSGTVNWTTSGSGTFDSNPCTLYDVNGVATCSVSYTPTAIGRVQLTASYSGDSYYAPSSASQTVTVVKRNITVAADPKTKVYGEPDPELTFRITKGSLVFNDTFTGSLTREAGEDVGQYDILQGTLTLPIAYKLTFVVNVLTITEP